MAGNTDLIASDFSLGVGGTISGRETVPSPVERTKIEGTIFNDILDDTPGDDHIEAFEGDDLIFATTGRDTIDGGPGFDTADYSKLGAPITLFPAGGLGNGSSSQLISIERIVGAPGQRNKIDASTGSGTASLNVNLAENRLGIRDIPNIGTLTFVIENFVDVTGTPNADLIVGSFGDDRLDGAGGNDVIIATGGNDEVFGAQGNDFLVGTDDSAQGAGERDVLTGDINSFFPRSGGKDIFSLGTKNGAYYRSAGEKDFAEIKDFQFRKEFGDVDQVELGRGTYKFDKDTSELFLTTGGIKELVARVDIVRLGSGPIFGKELNNALASVPNGNFTIAAGQTIGGFVGV